MSEFSDFMNMKIIENRRMAAGATDKGAQLYFAEQMKAVKNLNVRVPIYTIAQVEILANYAQVSKAEMVLEILQSSISEALTLFENEGTLNYFQENLNTHLEKNYGVELKRDETNNVVSFNFPSESSPEEND